jgi:hypothetical protein
LLHCFSEDLPEFRSPWLLLDGIFLVQGPLWGLLVLFIDGVNSLDSFFKKIKLIDIRDLTMMKV